MRIKHEFRHVEAQRGLLLSKKATQDIFDQSLEKRANIISPETLSHRFQQGWQHLQDVPENLLNSNNNRKSITTNTTSNNKENLNINHGNNNNPDDVTLASSPVPPEYFSDDPQRDSEDSGSSSDEEDSSLSFSDTSPLLDVSSLDSSASSSTSSSSNDSDDTDMSDDENFEDDDDLGNNNEAESPKDQSMDTSWMSFSSVASKDSPVEKSTVSLDVRRQYPSKRNGIVLPDVLPVGLSKSDDRSLSDELELQLRRRDLQLDAAPKLSGECCIVEITTQPDIQVDIRLNSTAKRPSSDPHSKHRNTYPRDAKNYNLYYNNTGKIDPQVTKPTQKNASSRESVPSRYFALGEGVRLNNFTIVNGLKALSLTELVKSDDDDCHSESSKKDATETYVSLDNTTQTKSSQTDEEPQPPSDNSINYQSNCFGLHSKDNRRRRNEYTALEQRPCIDVTKTFRVPSVERTKNESGGEKVEKKIENDVTPRSSHRATSNTASLISKTPVSHKLVKGNERKEPPVSGKTNESKISSPELFDVYTMETAVPHINWAAITRANKENEWIKKRQKDREEIRRKLAMDSDNEDYVSEKMSLTNETPVDRLKGSSSNNLQICFLNEAAKDTEVAEIPPRIEPVQEKTHRALPRMLKRNLLFPPNLPKCVPTASKAQSNNNNNSLQPQVVKRQRPTFFFNRPRSWHAAKVEEKPDSDEDLVTRHRRLQSEAREALAQAKDMARMQMEIERQKKKKSPIADIVGITFLDGSNLLSRHALLDMNVAQLQVIVNDLHSQIETLNEDLVKFLLERDDLHMEQDSMLVDIEDLTRYLGLKGNNTITQSEPKIAANFPANLPSNRLLRSEPVRRSQSVHLKRNKEFM